MEVLVLIIIIAGCCAFYFKSGRVDHRPPSRQTRPHTPRPTPRPFNAQTAKPKAAHPTLCGQAFVIDGDSIVIKKTQIRLFGVDAPEMNHPFGKKAKWALLAMCKGQTIQAEITAEDAHGRTVAKCYLPDGRDLSQEMVKLGLAIDWPKYSGGKYAEFEPPDIRKKLWLADAR